jgi:hypothetical protein
LAFKQSDAQPTTAASSFCPWGLDSSKNRPSATRTCGCTPRARLRSLALRAARSSGSARTVRNMATILAKSVLQFSLPTCTIRLGYVYLSTLQRARVCAGTLSIVTHDFFLLSIVDTSLCTAHSRYYFFALRDVAALQTCRQRTFTGWTISSLRTAVTRMLQPSGHTSSSVDSSTLSAVSDFTCVIEQRVAFGGKSNTS